MLGPSKIYSNICLSQLVGKIATAFFLSVSLSLKTFHVCTLYVFRFVEIFCEGQRSVLKDVTTAIVRYYLEGIRKG
jgi:hypothetical protein